MLLPTTRRIESVAPGSSAGSARREQETEGLETALPDSLAWSNPGGGVVGHSADAASFSHQAAAVGLRRLGHRDAQQRRSPSCRWTAAKVPEERLGPGPQPKQQSRSEEPV